MLLIAILEQPLVVPGPNVLVTSLVLTFPPADVGIPAHFHSGPVVGYVIEGELLFQVRTKLHKKTEFLISKSFASIEQYR